jgi:DNA (cytosine-5)-methyltransferase 1|tara:strand:- start:11830 stop:12672 length:843 start_codon:yes stop_codon:yes gene_type:complete
MAVYYNEFDPKAAAWLRQLIKNGNIADGLVDERSITEVTASDLKGFTQHHFFAGVGVWSYALRNAGWSDDRPVWTASLPCQPFSVAGNQKGKEDERHLLPHFIELVRQCKPDTIFGEQVEGAIRHGWLDDLQTNMEAEGFALGHCVLGAHSIDSPHIRQRLYWVAAKSGMAYNLSARSQRRLPGRENTQREDLNGHAGCSRTDSNSRDSIDWLYCRDNKYRPIKSGLKPLVDGVARGMVYSSDTVITPNDTGEARTTRLKSYGNAIVARVAEEFIRSFNN